MPTLQGKIAVVTGASKGIGAGIAKALAAAGATVVVNYSTSKQGADTVVEAITQAGGKAVAIAGNVSKSAEVDTLFAEVKQQFGHVDILINNAGVYAFLPLEAITEEAIDNMFEVNVKGLLLATKAAVALFPQTGGNIVNIGSTVTNQNPPASTVYTATKHAVEGITSALANELGPRKIRVNAINPGITATEGVTSAGFLGGDMEKMMVGQTPLGRIGQPDDIADAVTFIVSDEARWITGDVIEVSGGLR